MYSLTQTKALSLYRHLESNLLDYQNMPRVGDAPVEGRDFYAGDIISGWNIWLFSSGRGAGKTLSGAVNAVRMAILLSLKRRGKPVNIYVAGPGWGHVTNEMLFTGPSSIESILDPRIIKGIGRGGGGFSSNPYIELSFGYHKNVRITGLNANVPDAARGKEGSALWWDEPGSCDHPLEFWRQMDFVLRQIGNPKRILTTTPNSEAVSKDLIWNLARAAKGEQEGYDVLKKMGVPLINGEGEQVSPIWTKVPSWENTHLPKEVIQRYKRMVEDGDPWAQQEVLGDLIEGDSLSLIREADVKRVTFSRDQIIEVHLGLDAAVAKEQRDEFGIVAVGRLSSPIGDAKYVILEDSTVSGLLKDQVASNLNFLCEKWNVSRIIVEHNNGGEALLDFIRAMLGERYRPKVEGSWSSNTKWQRAEPVAMAIRMGELAFSDEFEFKELINQWTQWHPNMTSMKSPDRLDASVFASNKFIVKQKSKLYIPHQIRKSQ